jgi:RNA polymerase sigma-70 factor (ECF subfamily)
MAKDLHRPGPCQLQAEIAELHTTAPSYLETDWSQVRIRYDQLNELTPSPLIRLNRAVATRFVAGPEPALREVDQLADQLESYRQFHAVRAELLEALGRTEEADAASRRALTLAEREPPRRPG